MVQTILRKRKANGVDMGVNIKGLVKMLDDRNKLSAAKGIPKRRNGARRFGIFKTTFAALTGSEYPEKKGKRFVSYKDDEGRMITKKYSSDYTRFNEFFTAIQSLYLATESDIEPYIRWVIRKKMDREGIRIATWIFGAIVSMANAEKYFKAQPKKSISGNKKGRDSVATKHRALFEEAD